MTRVLVTRPAGPAAEVCAALTAAGLEPVCLPLITTVPVDDLGPLDAALRTLDAYDWTVFASANAARLFAQRARTLGIDPARSAARICAGPATAGALAQHGLPTHLLVEPFSAERALDALSTHLGQGGRVLLPRAAAGRDALATGLRARGVDVDEVVLYRTVADAGAAREAAARLVAGEFPAVVLFSPSAARALFAAVEALGLTDASRRRLGWRGVGGQTPHQRVEGTVTLGCIGPTTAAAVESAGWPVGVVAPDTTAHSLVAALAGHLMVSQASEVTG